MGKRERHRMDAVPAIGELLLQLLQPAVSSSLQLQIVRALVVRKDGPVYAASVDDIFICLREISAREIELERHRSKSFVNDGGCGRERRVAALVHCRARASDPDSFLIHHVRLYTDSIQT